MLENGVMWEGVIRDQGVVWEGVIRDQPML